MKSIKEKAEEYRRVIKVIDEQESIVDTQGSEIFEAGANYVISEIINCFPHTLCMNPDEVISSIVTTINELGK